MATASYSYTLSMPYAFFSDAMTISCRQHVLEVDLLEKLQ
jgi:hypothetical protein